MAVKSYTDLKEKTLAVTGFFETSTGYPTCYGITSGNHDGQGLSWGVLQFNLGQQSLQPIWNYLNNSHNQLCRDIFGVDYAEWNSLLADTLANQIAWGDTHSVLVGNEKRGFDAKWKAYFQTLGETQESISYQQPYADNWRPNAEKWFANLGLWSRRGYTLLWDISVQMGRLFPLNLIWNDFQNINTTGKIREEIEAEKLNIIVNRCSYDNRVSSANQTTVYTRKNMLVVGTGNYYGADFNIAQYDLEYEPAFEHNVVRGLYIG